MCSLNDLKQQFTLRTLSANDKYTIAFVYVCGALNYTSTGTCNRNGSLSTFLALHAPTTYTDIKFVVRPVHNNKENTIFDGFSYVIEIRYAHNICVHPPCRCSVWCVFVPRLLEFNIQNSATGRDRIRFLPSYSGNIQYSWGLNIKYIWFTVCWMLLLLLGQRSMYHLSQRLCAKCHSISKQLWSGTLFAAQKHQMRHFSAWQDKSRVFYLPLIWQQSQTSSAVWPLMDNATKGSNNSCSVRVANCIFRLQITKQTRMASITQPLNGWLSRNLTQNLSYPLYRWR